MASDLSDSMATDLRKILNDPTSVLDKKSKEQITRLLERHDNGEDDDLIESCCA